jgi:hypothetical protein
MSRKICNAFHVGEGSGDGSGETVVVRQWCEKVAARQWWQCRESGGVHAPVPVQGMSMHRYRTRNVTGTWTNKW